VDVEFSGRSLYCPECNSKVRIPNAGLGTWSTLDDFRLLEVIGCGGSGIVYLAEQRSMKREVAVKILHPELSSSEKFIEKFYREIKVTARLTHPNIVTAFKAGEDNGYHYLAMSYIPKGTLEDCVINDGPLPEAQALSMLLPVAYALAYAWDKEKLLHLDIKPENLLMGSDGQLKVTDLGIARCLNESVQMPVGEISGTPAFMSPEQAQGKVDLDVRSDIFSLGSTLYFMLTGEFPFAQGGVKEILRRVIKEKAPDPNTYREVTSGTVKLLKKMMEKDRRKRVESWSELALLMKKCLRPETQTGFFAGVRQKLKTSRR